MIVDNKAAAILWDIDGTLILTEELHFETIEQYCIDRNVPLTKIDCDAMLGMTMPEKWRYLRDTHSIPDSEMTFRAACAATYKERLESCSIRKHPMQVMSLAAESGILQACVSNGDRVVVEANIQRLGLASMIEFSLASDDFIHGKPAPEPYLMGCEKLGKEPSQCIAVEDSPVGVAAATAAGLTVIAWPESGTPFPDEAFSKAHYHIHSLEEFPLHLLGLTLEEMEVTA